MYEPQNGELPEEVALDVKSVDVVVSEVPPGVVPEVVPDVVSEVVVSVESSVAGVAVVAPEQETNASIASIDSSATGNIRNFDFIKSTSV